MFYNTFFKFSQYIIELAKPQDLSTDLVGVTPLAARSSTVSSSARPLLIGKWKKLALPGHFRNSVQQFILVWFGPLIWRQLLVCSTLIVPGITLILYPGITQNFVIESESTYIEKLLVLLDKQNFCNIQKIINFSFLPYLLKESSPF